MKAYLRYTDDMVLFAQDKLTLWRWRDRMEEYLEKLRLRFNGRKTTVRPVSEGVEWLGFRIYPGRVRILKSSIRRFNTRMKRLWNQLDDGRVTADRVERSIEGWTAHASHGDTARLRSSLCRRYHGRRGAGLLLGRGPCSAGRLLEQQRQELPVREPQQERPR